MACNEPLDNIKAKLRFLFPDGTPDAEEKRATVLESVAERVLGPPGIRDLAVAARLPLAGLEKIQRAVDGIVDAH